MLTSYDKNRYIFLKNNFDIMNEQVNLRPLSSMSFFEIILYLFAFIINGLFLIKTLSILFSYPFLRLISTLIYSYFAADFASGFVHWIPDSYDIHPKLLNTYIGPQIQEVFDGFKLHHINPYTIVNHSLINTIGSTFILVSIIQLVVYMSIGWSGLLGTTAFLSIFSNEFHKISHMAYSDMSFLHKIIFHSKLFLSKLDHKKHHKFEHELQGYTIISGICNRILDHEYVRFWERLELIVYYIFGIKSFRMITSELMSNYDDNSNYEYIDKIN